MRNDRLSLLTFGFVTAFLGVLDNRDNTILYHAGGQGPLMHFHAATGECDWHGASTMPMGFMETVALKEPQRLDMQPGDILGLITDGVYEYENTAGDQFESDRVAEFVRENYRRPTMEIVHGLLEAVDAFGTTVPQADDITIVLIRRVPD